MSYNTLSTIMRATPSLTRGAVEELEVIHQVVGVVGAGESDLEGLVAGNEGGQPGQALLARPTHTHQEGIAPVSANDAGDLDQVHHGVLEEHQVHTSSPHHVVVLLHVAHQLLREEFQRGHLRGRG